MKKLGLVAGGNKLPLEIVKYCENNNIDLYCALIKGFANIDDYKNQNFIQIELGQIGKTIKYFQKNNVADIVFAGNVKKPHFGFMKIDFKGFLLLKDILKNKILGDNTVIETLIKFLQKYNINVVEIDSLLKDIKLFSGNNTNFYCENKYLEDVKLGKQILEVLSPFDIGQSIVIQQGNVVGMEGFEGTKELIERCGKLKYIKGRGAILIKMKKTNQSRKIDLPTIGVDTIEQIHQAGFVGIAIDYNNCLVIDSKKVIELANKYNIFIYGI